MSLLSTFVEQVGNLVKLPQNLVKTSVHQRLIERGEKGESKVLIDKKMTRPSGERNYNRGDGDDNYRGRGRGRGRGDYNNRDRDGRQRGPPGREGFNTRAPIQEIQHDDQWRKEQDDL